MKTKCPHCLAEYVLNTIKNIGKITKCNKCGKSFRVDVKNEPLKSQEDTSKSSGHSPFYKGIHNKKRQNAISPAFKKFLDEVRMKELRSNHKNRSDAGAIVQKVITNSSMYSEYLRSSKTDRGKTINDTDKMKSTHQRNTSSDAGGLAIVLGMATWLLAGIITKNMIQVDGPTACISTVIPFIYAISGAFLGRAIFRGMEIMYYHRRGRFGGLLDILGYTLVMGISFVF